MKTKLFSLCIFSLLILSLTHCNKDSDTPEFPNAPDSTNSEDSATLAKLAQADSVYNMQKQFNTLHAHGKDLAVHAHQNIPKKRRMLKRAAEIRPQRIEALKRARANRQARIKEIQAQQAENE